MSEPTRPRLICPQCLSNDPKYAGLCDEDGCPGAAGFVPSNSARVAMKTFVGCQGRAALLEAALRRVLPFVLEDYYPNCATPEFREAVEEVAGVLELDLAKELQKMGGTA